MSIFGKIKGAKKAADQHKAQTAATTDETPKPAPYRHIPTHAAVDALTGAPSSWGFEDREQIKIQNKARMSRTGSSYSAKSSRVDLNRTSSGLSADWNSPQQPRSSASSLKTHSRNASYQGLAKVMEDSRYDHGEPVPPIPMQFSATSSAASSSRPRASRAHFSSGNAIGKSPLSSGDNSPVDSEESSNASASSNEGLQIRSQPVQYPTHNVFDQLHKNPNRKVGETVAASDKPERTYFSHKTSDAGGAVQPVSAPTPAPAATKKRHRFSLMKRGSLVAAQ
ncbi:hypothetical protein MBLNU459_g0478t1 [Dothideomycetes sp. NU459]